MVNQPAFGNIQRDLVSIRAEKKDKYRFKKALATRAENLSNQKLESEESASSEELNDRDRARSCWYCEEQEHVQQYCKKFGSLKHTDKIRFVIDKSPCFRCLKKRHYKSDCNIT